MPWPYEVVRRLKPVERLLALVENDQGVLQLVECAPLADGGRQRQWDGQSRLPITQLALRQRGEAQHRLYHMLSGR
jgi:hypothetical protein